MTTRAQSRPVDGEPTRRFGFRLRRRHVWLVPGLGIALFANAQAGPLHVGLVPLLVFGIVPHLTVLVGIGHLHARGQLAPRAVPLFNTMHWPVLPLAVLGLAWWAAHLGLRIDAVKAPFGQEMHPLAGWWGTAATTLWLSGVTGAILLSRRLQGLGTGLVGLVGLTFVVVALLQQSTVGPGTACLAAALAGVALGFFRYDFPPARLPLGSAGYYFLGFSLAAISVLGTLNLHITGHAEQVTINPTFSHSGFRSGFFVTLGTPSGDFRMGHDGLKTSTCPTRCPEVPFSHPDRTASSVLSTPAPSRM
jgi:UDP-N-acetylmuramyl pentapeptide phosphotransferase/UDP-N-acetylglucosamine-1-phosphate transferase